MEQQKLSEQNKELPEGLYWLDGATKFLDNRFRIPGTEIRFGFDFLIGLIPGIGDIVSFAVSGLLVTVMARKGASGIVILKMLGNIIIDALTGTIPIIGDLFDLTYRANRRNLHLLQEHYGEGEHEGSAWPVVVMILFFIVALSIGVAYMVFAVLRWAVSLI